MSDIAVVGCGPAGLAFAVAMIDSDHSLSLFDKFIEPKAVGSGFIMQPSGQAVAHKLGIFEFLLAHGHKIKTIEGFVKGKESQVLAVDYSVLPGEQMALGLHRNVLFQALFEKICASQHSLINDTAIVALQSSSGDKTVLLDDTGTVHGPFDYVVDASGVNSSLNQKLLDNKTANTLKYGSLWATLDLPVDLELDGKLLQRFSQGQDSFGIMPIGRDIQGGSEKIAFFWNIRNKNYQALLASGLSLWKEQVLDVWPESALFLEQIKDFDQLTHAQYVHHRMSPAFHERLIFIGDAAHSTSPQLGQGVNMSLLDAYALASNMKKRDSIKEAVQAYAKQRRWHVLYVHSLARLLMFFYQSDLRAARRLRDILFLPMTKLPYMKKIIAYSVAGNFIRPSD